MRFTLSAVLFAAAIMAASCSGAGENPESVLQERVSAEGQVPVFEWDPTWPQPLPNNWVLGMTIGVHVDASDHVWVTHRPDSLGEGYYTAAATDPPSGECCAPAPPILSFDQEGTLVRSWGGPGPGYEWPNSEHGIFVDHQNNVWLGSNQGVGSPEGPDDTHVLKFTPDGQFLLQIGTKGVSHGNTDTENMQHPSAMFVDPDAHEVYVTDGEWGGTHRGNVIANQRVIVFDADSGAFKRMWAAYGNPPEDVPLTNYDPERPDDSPHFRGPHGIKISRDGLVYVADRGTNRIQVFEKDGTFVKERILSPTTLYPGMASDVALSADPEQAYLYVADGMNKKVWVLDRDSLEPLDRWGYGGHWGGMFNMPHSIATDSAGNLYVTETLVGRRVQRFLYKGMGAPQSTP